MNALKRYGDNMSGKLLAETCVVHHLYQDSRISCLLAISQEYPCLKKRNKYSFDYECIKEIVRHVEWIQ